MEKTTAILLFISVICAASAYNLTILHTNDVHAHYVEFNVNGGRCPPDYAKEGKCYGGFARQSTKAKEIRGSHENVIFLNGGDFFQGTVWYTLYKWKTVAEFVNKLSIDAMSLGNHEFDDGLDGLIPYLETVEPKVTICNVDASNEPEFEKHIASSVILEEGGEKIGVIGFLTPDTKFLSSVGKLEFSDEVVCIQKEARKLTSEGINKIFAVGHSGYEIDMKIAREVPEIDVVVGGHTNTFLYTGDPPSVEVAQGPYPTVVEREDGSSGLVVQDFAFGKYLGYLNVAFDDQGKVTSFSGNPILLDSTVKEDEEIIELLKPYKEEVVKRGRQRVGSTNVLLEGNRMVCRMEECNLGNFLADAALDFFVSNPPNEEGWNNVAVSLWNSGGIRGSIDERMNNGSIILEDILTIAPFGNTMDIVGLKGKHLKDVLERSVQEYDVKAIDPPGSLLQVSGLRVIFNVSNEPGSRVLHVDVRCADCRIPQYHPLQDEKVYEVVLSTYLTKGGDGFEVIPKNAVSNRNTDELDVDIITQYMKKMSPATTGLESRLTILSSEDRLLSFSEFIPKELTNLGNLGELGNLTNVGQLGNLGELGNLTNLGQLGNLGELGNLTNVGQLGNLGELGNLTNVGQLGNLGELGNLGNMGQLGELGNVGELGNLLTGIPSLLPFGQSSSSEVPIEITDAPGAVSAPQASNTTDGTSPPEIVTMPPESSTPKENVVDKLIKVLPFKPPRIKPKEIREKVVDRITDIFSL